MLTSENIKNNIKELFTFNYYKEGLTGWTTSTKIWWALGMIVLSLVAFGTGADIDQWVIMSWLGGIIGFTCTLAITNGKRINGLLGLISALLISAVAINATLYADVAMQVGYIIALDIPVILLGNQWNKAKVKSFNKDISGLWQALVVWLLSFSILYVVDILLVSNLPMLDAFTASIGFVGAFLMLRKYSEQYFFWFMQGILSVTLWTVAYVSGSIHTVVPLAIYSLYLGNNFIGLFDKKSPWNIYQMFKK
ncbi:NMN transporter [Weissella phage PWc]|nr:NMN transporter [Weissella phage PWc]